MQPCLIAGALALPFLMPTQTARADNDHAGNPKRRGHPFSVTIDSINTSHFCGPGLLCIDAVGSANIPHLGKCTAVYQGSLDFSTIDPNTGCGPNPGTLMIAAASGDTLVLTLSGEHCAAAPGAPLGVTSGPYTVTGGTGHFEGATGGGTYQDINTSENPDFSGTDTAHFVGVLKLPEGSD